MAARALRRFFPSDPVTGEARLESRQLLTQLPGTLVMREWSGNLTEPTTFVSDKNDWIYVGQLDGTITRVSTKDGHSEPLIKLPAENVDSRGLYSLALDPDYATNGRLYAFYYALAPGGGREARVSRIDLNEPGRPETVLIRIPISNAPKMHHGGALEVDSQGYLYFAIGEIEEPKKVRILDAPNGKVFRFRTDGTIPTDNPFYKRSRGLGRAVWATGLREPMTSSLDPQTGMYLIHDVGFYQVEELDQIIPGGNYGWPYYEGNRRGPVRGTPTGHVQWPIYSYKNMGLDIVRPQRVVTPRKWTSPIASVPGEEGCAIMGGTFYRPTGTITDPTLSALRGDYLLADLCGGWIDSLDLVARKASRFASDLPTQILDIDYTDDGRIFVLARGDAAADNQIKVIEPLQAAPPAIAPGAGRVVASVHEDVTLQADVSGPGPMTYQWQHDGVDVPGATAPTLVLHNTNTNDSPGDYRLVATNPYGSTTSDAWTLAVVNRPRPDVTVTVSKDGKTVKAGDVLSFSAVATDAVDGSLPASSFSWFLGLHHNDHTHPLLQLDGSDHGSFTVGDYAYEHGTLAIDLTLTVTDSAGLTKVVKKSWPLSV